MKIYTVHSFMIEKKTLMQLVISFGNGSCFNNADRFFYSVYLFISCCMKLT